MKATPSWKRLNWFKKPRRFPPRARAIIAAKRAIYGAPDPRLEPGQRREVERIVDAVIAELER